MNSAARRQPSPPPPAWECLEVVEVVLIRSRPPSIPPSAPLQRASRLADALNLLAVALGTGVAGDVGTANSNSLSPAVASALAAAAAVEMSFRVVCRVYKPTPKFTEMFNFVLAAGRSFES
jgi:hypothetical protein